MRFLSLALAVSAVPALASAQSYERPHPELPSAEQPARNVPTTGYTLALSWSPEYCHSRRGEQAAAPECASRATRARFNLHGLWPDGDGPNRWPQYCRPVGVLSDAEIRAGVDATPSPQLLQHEWAKHGSCMAADPVSYFREEGRLFRQYRAPDMTALARRHDLSVEGFTRAFAAANPGLTPAMIRLNVNRRGWLEEVWLCLGKDKRPRPCPASAGGAKPGQPLRIQAAF